jgi:hypothetical protein
MTFATSNRRAPLCAVALVIGIVAVPVGCVIDLSGLPGSGGASPSTSTSTSTSTSGSETTSSAGGSTSSGSASSSGTGGAPPLCMKGETQDCYDGPPNTVGKGICTNGKASCNPDGKGFGACMGAVKPTFDDCFTAADENCDGAVKACKGDPNDGNTFGSANVDDALFAVASDQVGNIYVAGAAGYAGDGTYFAVNNADAIVTKIDATGMVVWSKTYPAGGGGYSVVRGVAVDPMGDVTITGHFQGAITANGVTLTSFGANTDLFVIKLDSGGSPKWSHAYGKDGDQVATSVTTDAAGNVFVAGFMNGAMDFGTTTFNQKGAYDAFVLRLDADGTPKWADDFGSGGKQFAWHVAAGPDGNVAVTGDFDATIVFPGTTPTTLTTAGGQDIFLAKLQGDTGAKIWSKQFGNGFNQTAYGLAIDSKNNLVIGGPAAGTTSFGGSDHTAAGGFDAYVAHFDKDGGWQWSQMFGEIFDQTVFGVAIDPADQVLITGQFQGSMSINGTDLKQMGGGHDIFAAKLKGADGTGGWARSYGDDKDQEAWSIASDPAGEAVIVGGFQGVLDFKAPVGKLTAGGGKYDAFWVKLGP